MFKIHINFGKSMVDINNHIAQQRKWDFNELVLKPSFTQ